MTESKKTALRGILFGKRGRAGRLAALVLGLALCWHPEASFAVSAGLDGATLPAMAGDAEGTHIAGDAYSVGPGLATAANQALSIQQLAEVGRSLCEQLAVLNSALQARMSGSSSAEAELLLGSTRELVAAMERMAASLSADIEATQHNPLNTEAPCADMASALANTGQQKSRESLDELQEQTLDETRRDGVVRNFAQAQGQQDHILLDSELMKDEKVFRPNWLLPSDGLITEQARSTYMIGVLANPTPAPKVSTDAQNTPGGRKGASALKIKSAQTGVAEGALRFVSQFYLPLTDYSQAVPELEENAGVDPADRKEKDELGHSLMQYFSARQQYFSGNINKLRESALWNNNDALKHMVTIMSESYHLQLENLRCGLYQTALLATLVGMGSSGQNDVVERYLAPLRQNTQESGS